MKKTSNILLIIFICLLVGCNKSESVEPSYGLISAKVQGINKQFIPPMPYKQMGQSFTIYGRGPEKCASSIHISCPISIDSPGTYTLIDHGIRASYYRPGCPGGRIYGIGCGCGSTYNAIEVSITFTVITNQRVKGTYNFTTDSFRVTDGTFDIASE